MYIVFYLCVCEFFFAKFENWPWKFIFGEHLRYVYAWLLWMLSKLIWFLKRPHFDIFEDILTPCFFFKNKSFLNFKSSFL